MNWMEPFFSLKGKIGLTCFQAFVCSHETVFTSCDVILTYRIMFLTLASIVRGRHLIGAWSTFGTKTKASNEEGLISTGSRSKRKKNKAGEGPALK